MFSASWVLAIEERRQTPTEGFAKLDLRKDLLYLGTRSQETCSALRLVSREGRRDKISGPGVLGGPQSMARQHWEAGITTRPNKYGCAAGYGCNPMVVIPKQVYPIAKW